jgi:hypothetical protein
MVTDPTDTETAFARGVAQGYHEAVKAILAAVGLHADKVGSDPEEQAALTALVAEACDAVQLPGLAGNWRYYFDLSPLTKKEAAELGEALTCLWSPHTTLTDYGNWLLRRQNASLSPESRKAAQQRALVRLRHGRGRNNE